MVNRFAAGLRHTAQAYIKKGKHRPQWIKDMLNLAEEPFCRNI